MVHPINLNKPMTNIEYLEPVRILTGLNVHGRICNHVISPYSPRIPQIQMHTELCLASISII